MPVKTLAVDVVTATKDTLLPNLATMMHEEDVGDVVIADGRKPIGIVTDRDVVATAGEMLKDVATVIESQSREYRPEP